MEQFLGWTAEKIKRTGGRNYNEFNELKSNKEFTYIFKYLQDSDQHLRRVEDHYKSQKAIITEDLFNLQNGFIESLANIQDCIFL